MSEWFNRDQVEAMDEAERQRLLAWAVTNCHTLARRRMVAGSADMEWWGHVLRICEKAGARSAGILRAGLPTEMTEG